MKKFKKMWIIILPFFLSACATTYQARSFTGGYSETQLAENMFQVSFEGNAYTRGHRTADFTLLRSAELTLTHGYKYFLVVDNKNEKSYITYTTPTTATTNINTNTYGTVYDYGNMATYSGNTSGTATTTVHGGQTYLISKPSSSNTIVCLKEKPKDGKFAYEAEFIIESIKEKYKLW